jgi:hypothetical protein
MAGGPAFAFELWVAHPSVVWKGGAFDFRCATVVRPTNGNELDLERVARPEGFEPPTLCLEGRCSIRLSYGRVHLNFSYYKRFRHLMVSSALKLFGMDRRPLSTVQSLRSSSSRRRILAKRGSCLSRHCCGKSAGVCPVYGLQGTCSGSELSPIATMLFIAYCEKI